MSVPGRDGRLLSAKDDFPLSSLQRAAAMVGRRVRIKLIEGAFPCVRV